MRRLTISERLNQRRTGGDQPKKYDVSYFFLRDTGDSARIRFLVDDIDDIDLFEVHVVQIGKRWLDFACNGEDCALCEAGLNPVDKMYIQLQQFNEDGTAEHKVWTRTLTADFGKTLQGLAKRYSPLSGHYFDIERDGAAGERRIKYNFYPEGECDADIVELSDITGMIRKRSNEDMEEYLRTGNFPNPYANQATKPEPQVAKPKRREPVVVEEEEVEPAQHAADEPKKREVVKASPRMKPSLRDRAKKHGF